MGQCAYRYPVKVDKSKEVKILMDRFFSEEMDGFSSYVQNEGIPPIWVLLDIEDNDNIFSNVSMLKGII